MTNNKDDKSFFSKLFFILSSFEHKIFYYYHSSRPGGWTVSSAFLLLALWYSDGSFPVFPTILAVLSLIGIVAAGSWINMISDRNLDKNAGIDVSFFEKEISQREMLIISIVFFIICLIMLFNINLVVFALGIIMVILFIFYSAPPIRLKTIPPLDCIVNGLVFGTLPVFIGWRINNNSFTYNCYFYGIIAGLVTISYFLLLSSLDIKSDKDFGIRTSCTLLGLKISIYMGLIVFLISLLVSFVVFGFSSFLTIALIISTPFFIASIIKMNGFYLRIFLTLAYYILTGSVFVLLFFTSYSKIPLVLFVFLILSGLYAIVLYIQVSKHRE